MPTPGGLSRVMLSEVRCTRVACGCGGEEREGGTGGTKFSHYFKPEDLLTIVGLFFVRVQVVGS